MARRTPAPCCCHCLATLDDVGGARVVQARQYGVVLREIQSTIDLVRDYDVRIRRLDGKLRDLCVAVWGHIDDATIDTAATQTVNGQRPWLCQRCADLLHPDCAHPLWYTPAAEVIHDDGKVLHRAILPLGTIGCVVEGCPNGHRPEDAGAGGD